MRISPATFVNTKARRPLHQTELMLRYGAAYGCMLVALAAAQLVSDNAFILVLVGVTVIGLPLSLTLRRLMLADTSWRNYRFLINSCIVLGSIICSFLYLVFSHPELLSVRFMHVLMVEYGVADSIKVLMELFLIFSTFRAVAIINDKEAVLSAVPSFSALLLLMVIHRGPQVVVYFAVWTVMASILFALDHRAESANNVHGRIASVKAGQDTKLSARSLATVLGFSLVISMSIAYVLSSRNPEDRSQLERWMMGMASGMTKLALNLPDISVNNGPERQIDYTSGPALPTRTELWRVGAITFNREIITPQYWRMFTLVKYDGQSWSQASGSGTQVAAGILDEAQWPPLPQDNQVRFSPHRNFPRHNFQVEGFNVNIPLRGGKSALRNYGAEQRNVRVLIQSQTSNIGYIPALPVVKSIRQRVENPYPIRLRSDSSIDMGVLDRGAQVVMLSSVPADIQYGLEGSPPKYIGEKPNPQAMISPSERQQCLQLPAKLMEPSSRLLKFTRDILKTAKPNENNYSRARRLAAAVESRGVYTLRPPAIPSGADAATYFLLDNPRGYCTYFAGALTVVCRLAGIPARVVSGFVNPERDSNTGMGILREANAHAWTEVWVPGWGWAPLDATPPGDRGNNSMGVIASWNDFVHNSFAATRDWLRPRLWVLVFPALLLIIVAFMFIRKNGLPFFLQRWFSGWQRNPYRNDPHLASRAVLQSYHSMARRMNRRFRPRTDWETSEEWLEAAMQKMRFEHPEPFHELTALYERARYAPMLVESSAAVRALAILRSLSWKKLK